MVVVVVVGVVAYGRQSYGKLEKCGFPVVPPSLFLGSNPDLHKRVQHMLDIQRFQEYGPVWGVGSKFVLLLQAHIYHTVTV
jgi:hypothetical protein